MSVSATDRFKSWVSVSDVRILLVVSVIIYAFFLVISLLLGINFNGIVSTLRQITFLSAIYAMLVLALNLQWGYAGLFNLGVAGFMAVGAYTMGILSTAPSSSPPGLGLPLPIGILGGILAAAVVGTLAALPALRLRGDYLAIVTLGISEIIRQVYRSGVFQVFTIDITIEGVTLVNFDSGFGGPSGMILPSNPIRILFYENPTDITSPPSAFGEAVFSAFSSVGINSSVVEGLAYTLVMVGIVAATYALLRRVGNSPFGRVLKAIREDELVAGALGKDIRGFKIKVFALGCALMGLASILWYIGGSATTLNFRPINTFYVFVALIIGGAGSNTGSVIGGAVFASLLLEGPTFIKRVVTDALDLRAGAAPNTLFGAFDPLVQGDITPLVAYTFSDVNVSALRLVLLGVVLIYLIQKRPEGLLGHRQEVASPIDLSERSGGDET